MSVNGKIFCEIRSQSDYVLIDYDRHQTNKLQNKCYDMGSVQEIAATTGPNTKPKIADEFLLAMIKSPNRRRIMVNFRLKNNDVEYRTSLTHKQYLIFRTIDCIEYCRSSSDRI